MLSICKTSPLQIFSFSKLTYHHSISILGLARDAAQEASNKTPKSLIIRARTWFFNTESHRLMLSSQKHDKPTGRSSQNRRLYFLRIPIWPNLRTPLKIPKCRILSQRIGHNLKNVSEKKAGPQKRKSEDKTKRVSRSLLDVYCIYWKKFTLIRGPLLYVVSLAAKWPTIPTMITWILLSTIFFNQDVKRFPSWNALHWCLYRWDCFRAIHLYKPWHARNWLLG